MTSRLAAVAAFALGMAWAAPIAAQLPPSRASHDIAWYQQHPAERATTNRLCHGDMSYDRNPDCLNAHEAEVRLHARRSDLVETDHGTRSVWELTKDPEYWARSGPGLAGRVQNCSSGVE